MDGPSAAKLRALPSIQRLLEQPDALRLAAIHGRATVTDALRAALDDARSALLAGSAPLDPLAAAKARLERASAPRLRRVINATGVVLHTNLGRAPLAREAIAAIAETASGYSNLEYDLDAGGRGPRAAGLAPLLRRLTGAEDALAVNNNAAAMLLALSALAQGEEVIVSRGELIEIGGGFRIPDIIAQSGARLIEVGTTNKTRLADYEAAVTDRTRLILKTHRSNFRMTGFTAEAGLAELATFANTRSLILLHDLGSGLIAPAPGTADEPAIRHSVACGAHLIAVSADKLMGGPQAGLVLGAAPLIARLRRHPLMRALRPDKLVLAALEATLHLHATRPDAVPALHLLAQPRAAILARAHALLTLLPPGCATIEESNGTPGGGTLPDMALPSAALAFANPSPDLLARKLRSGDPPVIGRIADGKFLLDLLTVADEDLPDLARNITGVWSGSIADPE